jgi:hypothetical protein
VRIADLLFMGSDYLTVCISRILRMRELSSSVGSPIEIATAVPKLGICGESIYVVQFILVMLISMPERGCFGGTCARSAMYFF